MPGVYSDLRTIFFSAMETRQRGAERLSEPAAR